MRKLEQQEAPTQEATRPSPPVCVSDYEEIACQGLPDMIRNYIAGAAGDELSLRRNRDRFDALLLKPRVLRDVSRLDTSLEIFGCPLRFPILLAPTAYQRMVHPDGELATARGASAADTVLVVSCLATTTFEEIAAHAACPLWFQLYVQRDRQFTAELVRRVVAAGCRALCVTVDTPVLGTRNREVRDGFALPPGLERANLRGNQGARASHFDESGVYSDVLDPTLSWRDIEWLRSLTGIPLILKGILAAEDAALAVEHGAAGIIVSNHGARNLDTTPAAIEALPAVVAAVSGRIPVFLDGGIRRGTDVVKALALGARAVFIGRPYLWGLAAAGASGVERVLRILHTELLSAIALCGRRNLAEIDRSVLWNPPDDLPGTAEARS
jgi:4-hydroxymandelate oxidase